MMRATLPPGILSSLNFNLNRANKIPENRILSSTGTTIPIGGE
jgi:hypothetical protein